MERPTHLRIVSLRQRLADVVQDRRPTQPEIVAHGRHVVEDLERMVEIVLMGVLSPPFDTFETLHLGENQLQQPRPLQQVESYGRNGRENDLIEFDGDALPRNDADTLPVADDRLESFGEEPEIQLRSEAHGPHHPQRIIRKGDIRVARRADDPLMQIPHPVERIDQAAEILLPERPGHRVDGKVAAPLVVFERPRLDLRLARIAHVRLLAGSHELDFDTLGSERRRAESLIDGHLGPQFPTQLLGQPDTAAHDHDVNVGRRPPEVEIADIPSDDEGRNALPGGNRGDLPENRQGQRSCGIVFFHGIKSEF